ncbi:MAG: hypothetical protein M1339_03745 [Bacteroidetes bacterium]|nr:hypothetical protein [Bacteroidota bacterium]
MTDSFYEIIPKQTDDQVREYINNHKRYTKECVEFAVAELAKRGHPLSPYELAKIREDVKDRDAEYLPHPEDNYSPSSSWKRNIPRDGVLPKSYEITGQRQTFILKQLAWSAAAGVVGYYAYSTFFYPTIPKTYLTLVIVVGLFVLEVVPSAILHIQYKRYNRGMKVTLDQPSCTLTISQEGETHVVGLKDARRIELVMNGFLLNGQNGGMDAWDVYHHAIITTKDGKRFVITCLLFNDLRVFFHVLGIKVWKVKRIYPRIKTENTSEAISHAARGA